MEDQAKKDGNIFDDSYKCPLCHKKLISWDTKIENLNYSAPTNKKFWLNGVGGKRLHFHALLSPHKCSENADIDFILVDDTLETKKMDQIKNWRFDK